MSIWVQRQPLAIHYRLTLCSAELNRNITRFPRRSTAPTPVTPYECTPASSHTSDGPKRTAAGAAGRINQPQGRCEGRKFRFQLLLCVYSTIQRALFTQDLHGQTGTDQAHERKDPAAHVTTLSQLAVGTHTHKQKYTGALTLGAAADSPP